MNSSVFEKVLLPAMLTSCTVFSVLMVGFIPRRPEPITIEPSDRIEASEDINHRDSVIRHIGMSIVLSVGAGITTAEMIRKWGRLRDGTSGSQVFSAQAMLQAVAMPDLALPVDGFAASLSSMTGNGILSDERTESYKQTAVLAPDRVGAASQPELPRFLFQRPLALPTETVNWFLPTQTDETLLGSALGSVPAKGLKVMDWQPTEQIILASREQYETCRVYLADAPERLLAILFQGEYYRFVKVSFDREQALSLAATIEQRGEIAVMTNTDDRYGVWVLAPSAYPETIAAVGADA
ncbi:hypothetical protein [Stenomitos frigidus]|uniref:Uncharacterized protein n=1 Tax=Stenomitos frigidus ULC18 TaxID=2107698 RepID=A0A2T1E5Q5_9CYAN|nr:hypothetical protein [Stenomitos frigidus]PSB28083.1 hypothetical protein C7B82_14640 [Stenomitos frigidus ULC18]